MGDMLYGGSPQPVPGGIADLLAGAGAGAAGAAQQPEDVLTQVLNLFPELFVSLEHSSDVHEAAAAFRTLTGIQKRQMQGAGGSAPPGR